MNQIFKQKMFCRERKIKSSWRVLFMGLLLACFSLPAMAQISISGTVTDNSGPMPGVNIVVKGTTIGAVTDVNGKYTISAPNRDAVLEFTFVGYTTQDLLVGDRRTIDVKMEESAAQLEEVVVVGYGTQRKSDLTGAVATVSVERLQDRPVLNFGEALVGQMAGVHIQQITGMPGGEGLSVRVRGTASITQSGSPLYVIDGFPMESGGNAFRMISPQDIESIQVLKDASSTAIYGSRGANGVVIITTKRGKVGKPQVSVSAQIGIQQREKKIEMMNRDQYVEWLKDGRNQAWLDQALIAADPDRSPHKITDSNERRFLYPTPATNFMIPDGQSKYGYKYNFHDPASVAQLPDNDWQDLIFRNAMMQQYDLSINGGSESTQYAFSGGYNDQDGIVISSNYRRYNFRSNIVTKVNNFLELGANLSAFFGSGKEINNGKDAPVMYALNLPPIYPIRNEDGTWGSQVRNPEILAGDVANPIAIAENNYYFRERYGWMGSFYAELSLLDGLKYKAAVYGRLGDDHRIRFLPSYIDLDGSKGPRSNEAEDQRQVNRTWRIEQTLTYNKTFAQKHALTLLGVHEAERNTGHWVDAQGRDLPTDLITSISGASKLQTLSSTYNVNNAMISYLARANYAYDNKYILTLSYRIDGSSRFGKNNRWGHFPSASVAWRIGQENFMRGIEGLTDLKLRASYGIVGNNRIGEFRHIGELSTGLYPTGNAVRIVAFPHSERGMSNPDLGWEKASQTNLGFDLSLIKNRIHLEADFYKGSSVDLLLEVQIPTITGNSRQMQNVGQVENKGMELMLSTRNFVGEFQWTTDFNIAFNRNKVLKLGPDGRPFYNSVPNGNDAFITKIGQPIACMYGYVYEGVFMNQKELDEGLHRSTDRPGDGRFKDVNGDKELNTEDKDIIGNNHANFTGGMNNTFSYRNWSLNVQMTFSQGAQVYAFWRRMVGIYHGDRNAIVGQLNRWRSEAEPGDGWYFRPTRVPTGWQRDPNSSWIEDASFLRVRNLSLSYNFDRSVAEKLHLSGLRVYATIQNLYTFTKYKGYDPEISTEGEGMTRGADYGGYPAARSFMFGVNVNF